MRMTLSRKEMVKKAALDVLKAFIIGVAAQLPQLSFYLHVDFSLAVFR